MVTGRVKEGEELKFLRETKRVYFIFGCDKDIKELLSQIYKKAVHLQTLDDTLNGIVGEERTKNIAKQREIKDWLEDTLNKMEDKFEKYLKLQH